MVQTIHIGREGEGVAYQPSIVVSIPYADALNIHVTSHLIHKYHFLSKKIEKPYGAKPTQQRIREQRDKRMLQNIKFIQLLHGNTQKQHDIIPQTHNTNIPTTTTLSPPNLNQCSTKFSRRELTIFANSSLLLLTSLSKARALETDPNRVYECNIDKLTPTKRAYLDLSIDGDPIGRIIIGLYENYSPIGATRFSDLVTGKAGISFRRKEFTRIMPTYVQHGGIRSYGVDAELARRSGKNLTNERLIEEWERLNQCGGTKNLAGTVSIIVRDPTKPMPKMKLVARKGKLEIDEEEVGVEPNGTEFTIAMTDSPELDELGLVVGRVIEGMNVVERIGKVKTVQENTSSPYFRVAKLIGDKRAVVAERGFNRPYSKVIVTNCGLLD